MAKYLCLLAVSLCFGSVVSQFGLFQNGREETARFNQNFFDPRRIKNKLTGLLHLRPEKHNTETEYVYPFDRPSQNIHYPNQQTQFGRNTEYNIEIVKVPGTTLGENLFNNNNKDSNNIIIVELPSVIQNGNAETIYNNIYGVNENSGIDMLIDAVNFEDYRPQPPNFNPPSKDFGNPATQDFSAINPSDNKPGIPNIPPPSFQTDKVPQDNVFEDNYKPVSIFAPKNPDIQKPGIPNVPPPFISSQKPDDIPNDSVNFDDDKKPGLQTFNPQDNKHGIPSVPPATFDATVLPPLTPVPIWEVRNNFNFGSAGLFRESCTTVDGADGSCISVYDCELFVKLLTQSTSSNPAVVQLLRKSHCGFEGSSPKVCCPKPGIPTGIPTLPPTTTTTTPAPTEDPKTVRSGDFISAIPEPPVCGFSNASLSRVVGGIPAKLGDFPWMALLGYKGRKNSGTRWLCGGSLISSKHVLTAAHCIHRHEDDLYLVRLGELDLAREDDGATPTDIFIKSKKKHEDYNPNAFTNDIGILVLEKEVEFTNLIRPVCIPRDSELRARNFENYNPIIAGWGDTEFRGPTATHLQVLQLPVVSNDFCANAYSQYKAQTIDERVLCAGYKKGGKDACQGDSGGPLMQPIWNSQTYQTFFYQIGVVSYGKKCAEPGFPGVYSRVTHFVPWIEEQLVGS